MSKTIVWIAAAALAALLGVPLAIYLSSDAGEDQFAQCITSTVAGGDIGGPFTLVNGEGVEVTDQDVITEPTLIYFGFTYCPDVCPLDVARNSEAIDLLEEQGVSATPIFISIDPERDTPDVVAEFADIMHPKMIGLTGSPEQIKAASQTYRTYYRRQSGGGDDYLVDHSTFTYLVLPEHGFVDFFRRDAGPEQIAETVSCVAKAAS